MRHCTDLAESFLKMYSFAMLRSLHDTFESVMKRRYDDSVVIGSGGSSGLILGKWTTLY